ncbi:hypothetical protein RND71_028253 [Anisodus tanguticus]|uniref:Uncharacterized protein n=1 Tax=Anisodus tanguticus TaxID=243964 RepID=A0AAE1V9X1_9SOLA|nr:hypothetical protein RND71_028253 [Anisodus tanguticus]
MATPTTTTPRYGQRDTLSTPIFILSSSPSHSSFGSLSFHDHQDSPFSPFQFSTKGVPFSWEHIPGIPKQQISRKNSSSLSQLLPLPPPAGNSPNSAKKILRNREEFSPRKSSTGSESFRKDPFFAAFVECSKDHQENHENFSNIWRSTTTSSKVMTPSTRSLSDKFGVISMYASCKRTCTVSESIVYLPRSRNYNLLSTRRTS